MYVYAISDLSPTIHLLVISHIQYYPCLSFTANNELTGQIPTQLGFLISLSRAFLGFNKLSGPIPSELGLLTKLDYLQLQDNQLTGQAPQAICNLRTDWSLSIFITSCSSNVDSVSTGVICPVPDCCSECQ